jgi:hypothetical protein
MRFSLVLVVASLVAVAAVSAGADRLDPWESRLISVGVYEFDARQGDIDVPVSLRAVEGETWLVQLDAPVREEAKDVLRAVGVEFYEYIPNNAFLCRIPAGREALVQESGAAAWMGRYHPAYKTSSRLLGVAGSVEVTVLGFPWFDGPELVADLEELGMVVEDWGADPLNVTVRGTLDAERIALVAKLESVYHVEPWIRARLHNHQAQWVMQTWETNNRRFWDLGLDGEGRVGSTSDSGIFMEHNMFRDPAVTVGTWGDYPLHRKVIAYKQGCSQADFGDCAQGWWHGTHTGGSLCGDDSYVGATQPYDGMALHAKNYFIDLGTDTGGFYGPVSLWTMFNYGYNGNAGGRAFVHSMSWGSNTMGAYSGDDRAVDNYIWNHRDCSVLTSAGNNDPGTGDEICGSPANAKSVIAVAASKNGTFADRHASWCSQGPTADGRIKPDIEAPGEVVWSSEGPGVGTYQWESGTSMASPVAAGCALIVGQYLEEGWYPTGAPAARDAIHPSAALYKAIMINGGDENYVDGNIIPNYCVGWGRTCLDSVLYFAGDAQGLQMVDDTLGIQTGQIHTYQYTVQSGHKLEVTLTWSDEKGSTTSPATTPKIVNDLDLEVQAPGGALYKGNVYSAGQSVTGGSYDRLNTVECVHLYNPTPGTYTVRVTAHDVPVGPNQPYALVVTGYFGGGDMVPPTAPPWVTLSKLGTLTWGSATDNVGVDHYCVYRQSKAYFSTQAIAPLATTSDTTWVFPGSMGNPATNYFFIVHAYDAANNESPPSPTAGEFDFDTSN